jgi:BlaI family transcriptional regulator, penicillinase repressor
LAPKRKSSKPKVKHRSKKTHRTPTPEIPDGTASREAVRDILNRMFGGSAEELVQNLAESNQLTPQEMARMKEIFGKRTSSQRKPGKKR